LNETAESLELPGSTVHDETTHSQNYSSSIHTSSNANEDISTFPSIFDWESSSKRSSLSETSTSSIFSTMHDFNDYFSTISSTETSTTPKSENSNNAGLIPHTTERASEILSSITDFTPDLLTSQTDEVVDTQNPSTESTTTEIEHTQAKSRAKESTYKSSGSTSFLIMTPSTIQSSVKEEQSTEDTKDANISVSNKVKSQAKLSKLMGFTTIFFWIYRTFFVTFYNPIHYLFF